MSTVRTVLGDIQAEDLGVCDAHDHLFLSSPRLPGQELADTAAAAEELRLFTEAGGRTVVQWTPYGMGRRAGALAGLARETGVTLVAATGLHQAAHYDHALLDGSARPARRAVRRRAEPSRANHATDWRLLDSLVALAEAGHAGQLLIGGDTTTAEARAATGGGPGMPFLLRRLRPAIERELGEATATQLFVTNPARAFQADW